LYLYGDFDWVTTKILVEAKSGRHGAKGQKLLVRNEFVYTAELVKLKYIFVLLSSRATRLAQKIWDI
jgi:hypothetical protein